MLLNWTEAVEKIDSGKLLHIAATEDLLRKLPKGNWIGGSTEYFLAEDGGKVTGELLDVQELDCQNFKLCEYTEDDIYTITKDAYENGYTILILPFDSGVHQEYAKNAAGYEDMFLKTIAGWISGLNLGIAGQTPIAVNGQTGGAFSDKGVALHIEIPNDKMALLNIVNIFSQDEDSPLITFDTEGFAAVECMVNGEKTKLADYIKSHNIDTQLPLVGDYGASVNISIKSIEDDNVNFYAPVFKGINYRFAKPLGDYAATFAENLQQIENKDAVFACNCILNFLYGGLEGKNLGAFYGPVTFGEIAYQLVNQTLVYVQVL